jgi:hypothetical protein
LLPLAEASEEHVLFRVAALLSEAALATLAEGSSPAQSEEPEALTWLLEEVLRSLMSRALIGVGCVQH